MKLIEICRSSLYYWVNRIYEQRQQYPPRKAVLYNQMTEAMRFAARKRGLKRATFTRTFVGLPELQQLIDLDLRATPCIELAECHHAAWCLGRVTALRPGSIGTPKSSGERGNMPFMAWKDLEITRGQRRGEFDLKLNVRILKTNHVADPEQVASHKRLAFNIKSPQQADNLSISVVHRLLAIALRRKALMDVENIRQLLDFEGYHIRFKPDFLSKPIFLAGGFRGLTIVEDKPLSAEALTAYLSLRGQMAG